MDIKTIQDWWFTKYIPQIKSYITMNVAFEELTPEELDKKRMSLLMEFLDSSDSTFLPFLLENTAGFFEALYTRIYKDGTTI